MHTQTCECTHMHTCPRTHACTITHSFAHVITHRCTHTHACTPALTPTYAHTCTLTCTPTHSRTPTHAHSHVHTRSPGRARRVHAEAGMRGPVAPSSCTAGAALSCCRRSPRGPQSCRECPPCDGRTQRVCRHRHTPPVCQAQEGGGGGWRQSRFDTKRNSRNEDLESLFYSMAVMSFISVSDRGAELHAAVTIARHTHSSGFRAGGGGVPEVGQWPGAGCSGADATPSRGLHFLQFGRRSRNYLLG